MRNELCCLHLLFLLQTWDHEMNTKSFVQFVTQQYWVGKIIAQLKQLRKESLKNQAYWLSFRNSLSCAFNCDDYLCVFSCIPQLKYMKVSKVSVQNEIVCDATIPSCTIVLILLSHNKQDQSYQNSCIFSCYTYFDSLTERESILIPLMLFVKLIDEYAHQAWNPWTKKQSSTKLR